MAGSDIADRAAVTRVTAPLFRIDPGWLFIAAGLAICVVGVLAPAQHDLQTLRHRLDELRRQETYAYAQLRAYSDFLDELEREDPALFDRLAAAQLNKMPVGYEPILLTSSVSARITDWIDESIEIEPEPPVLHIRSRITKLASGPHRLWLFGGAVLSVFVGLLLGPDVETAPRRLAAGSKTSARRRDRIAELTAEAAAARSTIIPTREDPMAPRTLEPHPTPPNASPTDETMSQQLDEYEPVAALADLEDEEDDDVASVDELDEDAEDESYEEDDDAVDVIEDEDDEDEDDEEYEDDEEDDEEYEDEDEDDEDDEVDPEDDDEEYEDEDEDVEGDEDEEDDDDEEYEFEIEWIEEDDDGDDEDEDDEEGEEEEEEEPAK